MFSSTEYFFIFSITFSFVSPTAIIKFISAFSCFFAFIVLFNATTGSVTSPIFLESGLEFFTICGISIFPLPVNFSASISYSKSPIVSLFVDKFTAIYISCSFSVLFLLFTIILFVSLSKSNIKNKLLNAGCA